MKSQGTQSELCSSPPPFPPPKSIPSSLLLSAGKTIFNFSQYFAVTFEFTRKIKLDNIKNYTSIFDDVNKQFIGDVQEMRRPEADSLPQVQRVRSDQRRRPLQFISRCR
ncbi:hypothetical protein ACS0TY_031158 [Phlomoides rotata]